MGARNPEEWPSLFEQHLNAGSLEAVVALYQPDATFVEKSGKTAIGLDAIRDVLSGLIERNAKLQGRVVKVVTAGDIAVLYTDWQGTIAGTEEHSRAIEVLRRQLDDTWLLVVGDPNGRA